MKISFNNVTYKYNKNSKPALNNLNFSIENNEIIFILGHTGSGKSTLLQHINGLLFPTSGEVKVEIDNQIYNINRKEKRIRELRKKVGLVFQFPENQLFESSVLEDVMFAPKNFGYDLETSKRMAENSLEIMGVDKEYYQRSPFDLSGGEKRKVAIAGVLASDPEILVLDEPTSSLDNKSTREFFAILDKLKKAGKMIVVVTHDVDLCYEYADKVMIMDTGNITYFGNYNEAFNNDEILKNACIEKPFVLKVKNKLNIKSDARNINQLILDMRGGSPRE